jgi:hypothetical protein
VTAPGGNSVVAVLGNGVVGSAASRLLEPLAMVWITYAVRNNHWTHAFSLLGRKD